MRWPRSLPGQWRYKVKTANFHFHYGHLLLFGDVLGRTALLIMSSTPSATMSLAIFTLLQVTHTYFKPRFESGQTFTEVREFGIWSNKAKPEIHGQPSL